MHFLYLKAHFQKKINSSVNEWKLYLKHGKNISMTIENKGEIYLK